MSKSLMYAAGLVFGFLESFYIYQLATSFADKGLSGRTQYFYLISYAIILLNLYLLPLLLRRISAVVSLRLFLLVGLVSSLTMLYVRGVWGSAIALSLVFISTALAWVIFDILLEKITVDANAGRVRGAYLTFISLGFLIGPIVATKVSSQFHVQGIFVCVAAIYATTLIFSFLVADPENVSSPLVKMGNSNFRKLFDITLYLEIFRAITVIYLPVQLIKFEYSWSTVGMVYSALLLLPLAVQYPLGRISDSKQLRKRSISSLLALAAGLLISLQFTDSNPALWVSIYVMASLIVACIEVVRESYFFRHIDGNDILRITKLRMARPYANFIGTGIAFVTLMFAPTTAIFSVLGILFVLALYPAIKLSDQ